MSKIAFILIAFVYSMPVFCDDLKIDDQSINYVTRHIEATNVTSVDIAIKRVITACQCSATFIPPIDVRDDRNLTSNGLHTILIKNPYEICAARTCTADRMRTYTFKSATYNYSASPFGGIGIDLIMPEGYELEVIERVDGPIMSPPPAQ